MKLRNLTLDESIKAQFKNALENEHTVLNPTEANAIEVEEKRKEEIKKEFEGQNKVADEVVKETNGTEVSEPKKVKDRKELSALLAEAKEAGKKWKISRCLEEGYRYLVEWVEEPKENLNEADKPAAESIEDCQKWVDYDMEHYGKISDNTNKIIKKAGFQIVKDDHGDYEVIAGKFEKLEEFAESRPNHDKISDYLSQGILTHKEVAEECLAEMSDDDVGDVLKAFDLDEKLCEAKEEKEPETFDEKMDFLAADEQEAIDGYEKIITSLSEEEAHVKEQLDKILIEEKAHKEFLEAVKADHELVYEHEEAKEEESEVDVKETEEEIIEPVEESLDEAKGKKRAGTVLKDNMSEWGKEFHPARMKTAVLACLDKHKDEMDEKDYKYAKMQLGKVNGSAFLEMVTTFMEDKAMTPNKENPFKEDLEEEDYFDFTNELYDSIREVLKEYAAKGVTKDDLSAALEFITVHMDGDETLDFLDESKEELKENIDDEFGWDK